jgi:hypothetical protein
MIQQAPTQQTPPMPPALYAVAKKSFPGASDQQILQMWGEIVSQMQAKGGNALDPANQRIIAQLLSHPDMQKIGQGAPQSQPVAHMAAGGDVVVPAEQTPTPVGVNTPMGNPESPPSTVSPQASLNQFDPAAMNAANEAYTQQANDIRMRRGAGNVISGFGGDSGAASVRNAETNAQISQAREQTVGNQEKLQAQATAGLAAAQSVQTMAVNAGKYGPELFKLNLANESTGIENKTKAIALDQTQKLADASTPESGAAREIAKQHFIDMGHPELAQAIPDTMNGLQATATAKAADDNFKTNNEAITAKANEMTAHQAASVQAAALGIQPPAGVAPTQPLGGPDMMKPGANDGQSVSGNVGATPKPTGTGTLGNTNLMYTPPGFTNPAATAATANASTSSARINALGEATNAWETNAMPMYIKQIKEGVTGSGLYQSNTSMRDVAANHPNWFGGDAQNLKRLLSQGFLNKYKADAASKGSPLSSNIGAEADAAAETLMDKTPKNVLKQLDDWQRGHGIQQKILGEMTKYSKANNGDVSGYTPSADASTGNKKYNPASGKLE